jgi:hypothetical protein
MRLGNRRFLGQLPSNNLNSDDVGHFVKQVRKFNKPPEQVIGQVTASVGQSYPKEERRA